MNFMATADFLTGRIIAAGADAVLYAASGTADIQRSVAPRNQTTDGVPASTRQGHTPPGMQTAPERWDQTIVD